MIRKEHPEEYTTYHSVQYATWHVVLSRVHTGFVLASLSLPTMSGRYAYLSMMPYCPLCCYGMCGDRA